mgnify:CR=1 FL=1
MLRKERIYVLVLVVIVFAVGFYIASLHPQVEIICPPQDTILSEQDYQVKTANGVIIMGKSTWDDVQRIFPQGKNLGMSTIYRPENPDCLLTFSEDENILIKLHIDSPELPSPRGIRVGDAYTAVEEQYGKNYTLIRNTGNNDDFDMVYGKNRGNSVTFKIDYQKVDRIIIQREVQ